MVSVTVQDTQQECWKCSDNLKMGPLNGHHSSLFEENRKNFQIPLRVSLLLNFKYKVRPSYLLLELKQFYFH